MQTSSGLGARLRSRKGDEKVGKKHPNPQKTSRKSLVKKSGCARVEKWGREGKGKGAAIQGRRWERGLGNDSQLGATAEKRTRSEEGQFQMRPVTIQEGGQPAKQPKEGNSKGKRSPE